MSLFTRWEAGLDFPRLLLCLKFYESVEKYPLAVCWLNPCHTKQCLFTQTLKSLIFLCHHWPNVKCKTEVLVIRLNLPCSRTFTVQYSRIELHIFSMFSLRSEKWQRFEKIWGLNHAGKLWNRWRRKHVNASILILRYYRNKAFYFLTILHKIKGTLYFHRE